jgi:hypothetical protein
MSNPTGAFLGSRTMLRPAHAVAALLQLSDGRYLMQLSDSNPDIFYPDHWGCFGGAVDAGEAPVVALMRELREELMVTLTSADLTPFTELPSISALPATASGSGPITRRPCRKPTLMGSCSGRAPISGRSRPEGCLQCPVWSRTTLSRCGCIMRAGGLHHPRRVTGHPR